MALNLEEGDTETPFQFIRQDQNHEDEEVVIEEHHYLPSINLTLSIRQFPSQGISFKIWAAANTLVTLLQQHHTQPNTSPLSPLLNSLPHHPIRILELGSGTGLVGIAASAILAAKVTITDLPNVLPNLQFNAAANLNLLKLNGGSVSVSSLRWGQVEDMESIGREFDLVMGSDLVYHDNLYEPLLKTMQFFLLGQESDVVCLMAHSRRWKKESAFFKKARKMFQSQITCLLNILYSEILDVVKNHKAWLQHCHQVQGIGYIHLLDRLVCLCEVRLRHS